MKLFKRIKREKCKSCNKKKVVNTGGNQEIKNGYLRIVKHYRCTKCNERYSQGKTMKILQ